MVCVLLESGSAFGEYIKTAECKINKASVPSLQEEFASVVRRIEGLRARMSEADRQIEGLLAQAVQGGA